MKRSIVVLFAVLAIPSQASTFAKDSSQEVLNSTSANYGLAERFSALRLAKMLFSTQVTPMWFTNSDKFIYQYRTSQGDKLYLVDPDLGQKKEILDMDQLAMQLTEIIKDPFDGQHVKMENLDLKDDRYLVFSITSSQDRVFANDTSEVAMRKRGSKQSFFFQYDINSQKLEDVTEEEQDKDLMYPYYVVMSPDGTRGIYVKGYDLYMMDAENLHKAALSETDTTLVEVRLTEDGSHDFCWGADNYKGDISTDKDQRVRPSAVVWSPDSKLFATIRWDMSRIKDGWVINSLTSPRPTLESFKYQMPGEAGSDGYLYLFDTETKKYKQIKTSAYKEGNMAFEYHMPKIAEMAKDHMAYVQQWVGDENGFYLTNQSRDHKNIDLCYVPVHADSSRVVVSEQMNSFIENKPIVLLNKGKQLIQWSERNGWANLYLYKSDGTLVRNLTKGSYHVENVLGVNEKDGYAVFSACGVNKDENPYQMHTYKVSLDGGPIKQLDMADMDVQAYLSDNAQFFIANYSRVDHKPASALYNVQTGKKVMELEEADFSSLMKAGYKFPERFKLKAADGITDLYGVMYKPFDFDSTKVYPIIDYVYPGPVIEANSISWNPGMNRTDRLAQLGFIVITVGNRGGHPNRSKWYHNYGYGNLRDYGLADQKYAIQQLADQYSFIDKDRAGIHGHSGGGFMSTAALLTYPDFFKVAVSCSGNHDNRIYSRWWSEQHNGYQKQPENQNKAYAEYYRSLAKAGDTSYEAYAEYYEKLAEAAAAAVEYKVGTNQELVKNLNGHLLLVHGDMDDNVSMSHSLRVVDALIKNHKRFDMLILPGQRHWFSDMDEYFFWRLADYFSEWLKGDSKRREVNIKEMNNDL